MNRSLSLTIFSLCALVALAVEAQQGGTNTFGHTNGTEGLPNQPASQNQQPALTDQQRNQMATNQNLPNNMIPHQMQNMIPHQMQNMIPHQMQNMIPHQMQNLIPNQMQNLIPNGNQMQNLIPNGNQMQNLIPNGNQMPWNNQFGQNNQPFYPNNGPMQQMNPNQMGGALTNMLNRGMSLVQAFRQLLTSIRNGGPNGQAIPNYQPGFQQFLPHN